MGRRQVVPARIREEVIDRWGDSCWLELPGCTHVGEEDDHIVPWSHGGMDTVSNIRRACKHCNAARQDRVLYGYGARLHMVLGPPKCGLEAREWIAGCAAPADAIVDHEALASALAVDGQPSRVELKMASLAWASAYRGFATSQFPIDAWCVRSMPSSPRHPRMLDEWIALDYDIHVLDVPFDVAWDRCTSDYERRLVRQWFALRLSQPVIDARQQARKAKLVSLGLRRSTVAQDVRPVW